MKALTCNYDMGCRYGWLLGFRDKSNIAIMESRY